MTATGSRSLTCSPPGDDNGEDASIDGEHGDEDVGGRGQGSHDVGPDTGAVHELHEEAQPALQQRAVLPREHDLEVTLQAKHPPLSRPAKKSHRASCRRAVFRYRKLKSSPVRCIRFCFCCLLITLY